MASNKLHARLMFAISVCLGAAGCASPGEAPAGPGATSKSNLRPWLKHAEVVTWTGKLQYFHCTSERGNYYTWSLSPAGPEDANEVDVRACLADARQFENRFVTITGKLIPREPRHFPILVARRIELAPPGVEPTIYDRDHTPRPLQPALPPSDLIVQR